MKILIPAAFALALAAAAHAHEPDRAAETAEAVRQADLAFARAAQATTPAKAFRDFMDADEGLLFGTGPNPTRGSQAIFELFGGDAPATVRLEWTPTRAWGSRSGDMGVTTGDWRRTYADGRPLRTGRYVTVWRKDEKGQWKGLIDIGEVDDKAISNAVGALPAQ